MNCYAITLISCLTSQNTQEFSAIEQVDPELFANQANLLLSDFKIDVLKIGVLKGTRIIEETKKIIDKLKNIKVVIDPVIRASTGGLLSDKTDLEALRELIFPNAYLITPNLKEAKILSGEEDLNLVIEKLRSFSSCYFLIKDVNLSQDQIVILEQ